MNKSELCTRIRNRDFQALMQVKPVFWQRWQHQRIVAQRLAQSKLGRFYLLEGETLVLGPSQAKLPVCGSR